ncbi:MAG: TRAP transporter large permease [Burkholderiaceae bacterium]
MVARGLAVATILSCAVFAAISGSSPVTMLAVGAILYPALLAEGYDKKFALGAITSAGTLGIIIPPSIPMILFGLANEKSIVDLFIAGIIPGLLLTVVLAGYSLVRNRHLKPKPFSVPELAVAFRRAIWALLLPVILLGGIYSGYFSPTESAAVAVVYGLLVEIFIHREMKPREFYAVAVDTAKLLGTLIPIVAVSLSLQKLLTVNGVQAGLAEWVISMVDNKIAFLLLVNLLLLVVGCFIDVVSATLVLSPLLLAPAMALGIDPIHFGIIMVINLEIGFLTRRWV